MDDTRENSQKILALLGVMGDVRLATESELQIAKSRGDAYFMTWKLSGKNRQTVAYETGIAEETLSRMFNGSRACPPGKEQKFYESCRNVYYLQWLLYQFGFQVGKRSLTDKEEAEYWKQQAMEKAG